MKTKIYLRKQISNVKNNLGLKGLRK